MLCTHNYIKRLKRHKGKPRKSVIEDELQKIMRKQAIPAKLHQLDFFQATGDVLKHERLKTKVEYDIEMMQEVGYVNGIENYSRYLDGRNP
jgi:excinuclease ABC subunit B